MTTEVNLEDELRAWYERYLATFIALARGERSDAGAMMEFFAFPLVRIGPTGLSYTASAGEHEQSMAADARRMHELRYATSQVDGLSFRVLSATAAIIEGRFTRLDRDGGVISSFATLYLLGHHDGAWRIVALAGVDH